MYAHLSKILLLELIDDGFTNANGKLSTIGLIVGDFLLLPRLDIPPNRKRYPSCTFSPKRFLWARHHIEFSALLLPILTLILALV